MTGGGEDIEGLRALKRRYELILSAAGEGIYGLNCDGLTTFANAAAERILGWPEAALIGKPLHDVHHHSHRDGTHYPREECPIYAALKDGEVHQVDDEVFWHANGSCIPVEYTSTPIWEAGSLKGAVVVFRDISERIRAERERAQAYEEVQRLKELLELERDYLRDEINTQASFGEIIGESQALKRTMAQINAVAKTSASVLVLGESGVGKEMIARAIHCGSERSEKSLVKVNCASIPGDLFESEFFGHVKGSFTGAHRDRVGRLELANGGTLFLDEVGEIPLDLQGKLLRALQEGEFERVGDEKTLRVDVRIVAATNKDLLAESKAGRFREDLYYRLSVFPINVPALRERVADIAPLAQHFISKVCTELGRPVLRLTKAHHAQLSQHAWPGNIRELKNVIERAVILSDANKLRLDLALPAISKANTLKPQDAPAFDNGFSGLDASAEQRTIMTDREYKNLEKINILRVLKISKGKISGDGGAAELLGLKPSTLSYRIAMLGIDYKK
ncbi:DNA-binding protein Fis [Alteromonadaceae bacterium Bs31]|nr:DNA-binding protein Fis [Alteromonadaceae bacterium Bs31]